MTTQGLSEASGCEALLQSLLEFRPLTPEEAQHRDQIAAFVRTRQRPFDRAHLDGHLTASALIMDSEGQRILFGFHRKLNRWLQLGGHGEPGEACAEAVALREAVEESGMTDLAFHPAADRPFDVDVHVIPRKGEIPEHLHLDLRYLLVAGRGAEPLLREAEHLRMQWFSWEEAETLELDASIRRMMDKARSILGLIS